MIAAIYARKSNEQQGVADEAKSVARQGAHARAYAERKGWTVAEEHLYVDDGVSGAEFVKRPGLARLLNTLSPRPPFQVLVMSEESRLGREQIETAYVLKRIMDAGVRVFFYLEDRERTLDSAMDKVMLSLTNFAAEVERERASQRVYDAAKQRAAAGRVAGAKIYGYDNVPVLSAEMSGRTAEAALHRAPGERSPGGGGPSDLPPLRRWAGHDADRLPAQPRRRAGPTPPGMGAGGRQGHAQERDLPRRNALGPGSERGSGRGPRSTATGS